MQACPAHGGQLLFMHPNVAVIKLVKYTCSQCNKIMLERSNSEVYWCLRVSKGLLWFVPSSVVVMRLMVVTDDSCMNGHSLNSN